MKHGAFFFLTLAAFLGCAPCDGPSCPHTPPVPLDGDASAWVPRPDAACDSLCACACLDWKRLSCPEAEPTAKGVSCLDTCVLRSAIIRTSNAQSLCWSKAKSVAALQACGGVRCIP